MRNIHRIAIVMLLSCVPAIAQTTKPSLGTSNVVIDRTALEVRANQEFERGQYAAALPMLKKLAEMTKDRPDLLGPIQEKIRVCEKNISTDPKAGVIESVNATRKPHVAPKAGDTLEM